MKKTSQKSQRVCVLNYHEVTQDPRVYKEAVGLAAKGYQVDVFCDVGQFEPGTTELDGVRINRFDCFGYKTAPVKLVDAGWFLQRSRDAAMPVLEAFQRDADEFQSLVREIDRRSSRPSSPEDYKSHYKGLKGVERSTRKTQFLKRRASLLFRAAVSGRDRWRLTAVKRVQDLEMSLAEDYKTLYQLSSFLFATNLEAIVGDRRFDIVHAHDIYTLPGAITLARRDKARVIFDAHEIETARASKMPPEGIKLVDDLERDCLDKVDAVVTVSDAIADFYAERFEGPHPTVVMNAPELGLDPAHARANNRDLRSRVGLSEEVPLLIYTGGVQRENRGLDRVVEALSEVEGCHLAIMGPRHHLNDPWLMEHADRNGVQDRIHLLRPVPAHDVVGTIATATAAIIPIQAVSLSYSLAMPNKLFEAAFARIPVIASDLPAMGPFIRDNKLGLIVDQTDPKSIAQGIRDVIREPSRYTVPDEDFERLTKAFSWEAQLSRLEALYSELSSERAPLLET